MEAIEIIEYLREQNFTLKADGEYLELSPPEKITVALMQRLRKHKPEIIAELKRQEFRSEVESKKNILLIQSWLIQIGEPAEEHFLILDKCEVDPRVMEYFIKHIRGEFDE